MGHRGTVVVCSASSCLLSYWISAQLWLVDDDHVSPIWILSPLMPWFVMLQDVITINRILSTYHKISVSCYRPQYLCANLSLNVHAEEAFAWIWAVSCLWWFTAIENYQRDMVSMKSIQDSDGTYEFHTYPEPAYYVREAVSDIMLINPAPLSRRRPC